MAVSCLLRTTGSQFWIYKARHINYNISMKEIKDIGSVIGGVIKDLNIGTKLNISNIFNHWEEIVGTQICRKAKPERISRNTLYVSVASSTWANELSMMSSQLISEINSFIGEEVVKRIKFRQNL